MIAELTLSADESEQVLRAHLEAKCKALGLPPHIEIVRSGLFGGSWKAICRDDAEHAEHLKYQAEIEKALAKPSTVIYEPDYTVIARIPAR